MQKKSKPWVLLLALFFMTFIFIQASAQEIPSIQVKLSPTLQQGLQAVHASDLDIFEQNTGEYLFDLEIRNVLQDWENTSLDVHIEKDGVPILSMESFPFLLPIPSPPSAPGALSYTANNIDLFSTGQIPGTDIAFNFSRSFNSPSGAFDEQIFRSGKFERGNYRIRTSLINSAWGPDEVQSVVRLNIINPSLILLQSPAHYSVSDSEFPFFKYNSDATQFVVYVYKRINEDDDISTVLSGQPTLEYDTPLKEFTYNITGGFPLEDGATYYWYVEAQVFTSHGLESFESNVWQFSINTEGGRTGGSTQTTQLMSLLLQIFGDDANQLLSQLAGYEVKTITYNGEIISITDFLDVLQSYGNNIEISGIEIQ